LDDRNWGAAPFVFNGAGFPSMRNPLQRRYGRGDLHFITFSCVRRRPLLGTSEARNCFVETLPEIRLRHRFRLIGYVVMPEHVHLLMSEPAKGNPSKAIQVLKQRVSARLLATVSRGDTSSQQHFWQRRFYDFNVWNGKKITEKLNYMHLNPVKRGLVVHSKDWPWSSWSHYNGEKGLIEIDRWGESTDGHLNPHP
jgi:putative transposase